MADEAGKAQLAGQRHGGMGEVLDAQPVVVAHHPVPRVAHQRKTQQPVQIGRRHHPVDLGEAGMFPEPPRRLQHLQPGTAALRLGRVADQDVIGPRPRLQRERQRRAAGLGDMHEDVAAAARDDHAPQTIPARATRKRIVHGSFPKRPARA